MRISKQLNKEQVRSLSKRPGTHNVGGVAGLCLQVMRSGSKSWVLRATIAGRVRTMGLGPYAEVSLKQAREAAAQARAAIREGRDPIEERRRALEEAVRKSMTFKEATKRYFEQKKRAELRSDAGRRTWMRAMEIHTFPLLGQKPVAEVTRYDVLKVLEPTWPRPSTVALRAQIEAVLEWSAVRGYRDESVPNPASWRTLKFTLSLPNKAHKVKHHAALAYQSAPAFIRELRAAAPELGILAAAALELVILTAVRSGQARSATWKEIDLDGKLWEIPGERMKAGLTHRVPLSDRAIELLESVPLLDDRREGLVFPVPSRRKGGVRPFFDYEVGGLNHAIAARLGLTATVHGWRSTFKDWARNCATRYVDEVSELALAHVSSDATRAAYARDELIEQRAKLMQDWAIYLDRGLETAEVVDLGRAKEA